MKRFFTILLCVAVLLSFSSGACAAELGTTGPADATEVNTGPAAGNAFFVFALVLIVLGGIYLFFKFRR